MPAPAPNTAPAPARRRQLRTPVTPPRVSRPTRARSPELPTRARPHPHPCRPRPRHGCRQLRTPARSAPPRPPYDDTNQEVPTRDPRPVTSAISEGRRLGRRGSCTHGPVVGNSGLLPPSRASAARSATVLLSCRHVADRTGIDVGPGLDSPSRTRARPRRRQLRTPARSARLRPLHDDTSQELPTHDTRHTPHATRHPTPDTRHATCGLWFVACGVCRRPLEP
jgi:hypothetical protein